MRLLALLGCNLLACLAAVALVAASPALDGRVGLMAPRGVDAALVVAAAGGRLVATSPDGRFAIARSETPDLRARLLAGGAVLVFNPALAWGCNA